VKALALIFAIAAVAHAADATREVHGSGDVFSEPGVALAWAIERGAAEAATTVVVRVSVDTRRYPWMSAVGIDPFTKAEQVRQPATSVPNMLDVRMPRAQFGDYPHTQFRFYASEADARSGTPALVVFYHGVPDTTPEFANPNQLDAHLMQRVVGARKP
jgi:hypothetical protein